MEQVVGLQFVAEIGQGGG